jgi:hypothetical protein
MSSLVSSSFIGGILAIAAAAAAGCAASSDSGHVEDAEVVTKKPGEEGGRCGGIAGIPCEGDLECKHAASHPDATGTCVKKTPAPGEEGGRCGGIAGIGCTGADLKCAIEAVHPDAAGTCVKK